MKIGTKTVDQIVDHTKNFKLKMRNNPKFYDHELATILDKRAGKVSGNKKWTNEEKKLFDEAVIQFGKDWPKI